MKTALIILTVGMLGLLILSEVNTQKLDAKWGQNYQACGQVGYYQDINGDCTLVQELR